MSYTGVTRQGRMALTGVSNLVLFTLKLHTSFRLVSQIGELEMTADVRYLCR